MSASPQTLSAASSQQLLASLWQRNLPLLRERLASLDAVAASAEQGELTKEGRKEASCIAHKLAGSLGMFGYFKGTEIAREMEVLLESEGSVAIARFTALTAQLNQALPI